MYPELWINDRIGSHPHPALARGMKQGKRRFSAVLHKIFFGIAFGTRIDFLGDVRGQGRRASHLANEFYSLDQRPAVVVGSEEIELNCWRLCEFGFRETNPAP